MRSKISRSLLVLVLLLIISVIAFLHYRKSVFIVSAVEVTGNIGIYWDENCSKRVYSIDWGILSPGQMKNVPLYVRNEGNGTILLVETANNWNPTNASQFLSFSWYCGDKKIEAGEIAKVTQTLFVSSNITGITSFIFDIVFESRKYYLGDVNRDGIVDIVDLCIVISAFRSTPQSANWNPNADLNEDGKIYISDLVIVIDALPS